jgi:hypothetical protein
VTAPRLYDGMSAHEQQDILDGQVQWWLEHGKSVELLIGLLVVGAVVFLLAVLT